MTLKKIIITRHGDTWKVSREREGSGESGVFSTLEQCFDYVRAVYDDKERHICSVFVFKNGMVATFDQYGQQMPDYQGPKEKVWDKIQRDKPPGAVIEEHCDWRNP